MRNVVVSNSGYSGPELTDQIPLDLLECKATLLASFLTFTRYFYKVLTGRDFIISKPIGRESHFVTIARSLTKMQRNPKGRLYIAVPPGYAKSTMCCFWVAWCLARYPDSKFLYISHSKDLSTKHTDTIRQIIMLKEYYDLFGVKLRHDARGKEYFATTQGGEVAAFGLQGGVTGRDGGMPGLERFTGGIIIDDAHTAEDVNSDTKREKAIRIFKETVLPRKRGINVPIIMIAQRLRELDLPDWVINGGDGHEWDKVILEALDGAENALYPEKDTKEDLILMRNIDPYTFWAQYQQRPQPPGGSLFKTEYFTTLPEEPDMLCTWITMDTAETEDNVNDATAISFWGLYRMQHQGRDTGMYAIHWIDCWERRVLPADLEDLFYSFWSDCLLHKVKPSFAIIEEESTGVSLVSYLRSLRGLQIRPVKRTRKKDAFGNIIGMSKSTRFISMQKYINRRQITLPAWGAHNEMCITHMSKITANESHAHDDICDTVFDAIKVGLMDENLIRTYDNMNKSSHNDVAQAFTRQKQAIERAYYGHR